MKEVCVLLRCTPTPFVESNVVLQMVHMHEVWSGMLGCADKQCLLELANEPMMVPQIQQ